MLIMDLKGGESLDQKGKYQYCRPHDGEEVACISVRYEIFTTGAD